MRLFRPNIQKMLEKKDADGLIKALSDKEADIRLAASEGLGELRIARAVIPLCTTMKDGDADVRLATATTLGLLADARSVEPLVVALRDIDPDVQHAAADALLRIGATAVRSLCKLLGDPNSEVRIIAVQTLGDLGDASAMKPLAEMLKDTDVPVREATAMALGKLGPTALEPLCAALRDQDVGVRESASDAIDKIGVPNHPGVQAWYLTVKQQWSRVIPLGEIAVEPLCQALSHPYLEARRNAARGLGEIGGQRATGPLLKCLRDAEWEVRDAVAEAIGMLRDRRAVKPLLSVLNDRDAGVREAAVKALGGIADPQAVPALVAAIYDIEWAVSQAASEALIHIGREAVIPLSAAMREGTHSRRKLAAETLEKVGVPDNPAIQAWFAVMKGNWEWARSYGELAVEPCIAALQDDDHRARRSAAELLGDLRDKRAVIPLCAALKDRRQDVRTTITEVLARMGPLVVEPLIIALADDDWTTRMAAAKVLGHASDERALEPLCGALRDSDGRVREAAADAIDGLGLSIDQESEFWYAVAKKDWKHAVSLGVSAIVPLVNALHDQDGEIRQEAARALGLIGDDSVADELHAAVEDEEWYVRDTALAALEKLGFTVEFTEGETETTEQV